MFSAWIPGNDFAAAMLWHSMLRGEARVLGLHETRVLMKD